MVSRPAWPRSGIDGGGLRRRLGPDGRADCQHDSVERVRIRFPVVRPRTGPRRRARRADDAGAGGRRGGAGRGGSRSADAARLHAGPGARDAGVLDHVCDVRHGGSRRPDGGRSAGADRDRLQGRRHSGFHSRPHAAGAHLRADDRPRAQRPLPAVLRLGIGSHRPREHDVRRLPRRGNWHLRAAVRSPAIRRCS